MNGSPAAVAALLVAAVAACGGSPVAVSASGPRARADGRWRAVRLDLRLESEVYRGVAVGYEILLPAGAARDLPLIVLPAHPRHALVMRGFLEHLAALADRPIALMFIHAANVAHARAPATYAARFAEPAVARDALAIALAAIDDALARAPRLARDRVSCLGWSGSANGCWMLATDAPDRIAAIHPISAGFNPPTPGADFERLRCTAVRIVHGARDPLIPIARPRAAAARLRALGAEVELVELADAGHSDHSEPTLAAALAWLARQRLRTPRCSSADRPAPRPPARSRAATGSRTTTDGSRQSYQDHFLVARDAHRLMSVEDARDAGMFGRCHTRHG